MSHEGHFFDRIVSIIERLRAPDGCPWDREQTLLDLRTYIIEEAYELTEAISQQDAPAIQEEAGDLLLQIVFVAALAKEKGLFTIADVVETVCEKLVRRHPHVFAGGNAKDSGEVLRNWEKIKQEERGNTQVPRSVLAGVPKELPPLLKAYRIQGKAAHVGFDWPKGDLATLFSKLEEEIAELRGAVSQGADALEDELGDVLFMTVNLSRHLGVNPDAALSRTCRKFSGRFQRVESLLAASGRDMGACSLDTLDELWEKAKQELQQELSVTQTQETQRENP